MRSAGTASASRCQTLGLVSMWKYLNSFTSNRERADEFGDYIPRVEVPLPKIFLFNHLLPGMLKGEDEYLVIGGLYEVAISPI